MSAILPPEHHADWLDPNPHDTALPLDPVRPAPPEGWNPEPASRRANSPHDDDPGLIEPPTPAQPAPQATSDTTRQGAQPPLARTLSPFDSADANQHNPALCHGRPSRRPTVNQPAGMRGWIEPPRTERLKSAPVAQLDRVPGYEPGGREFESLRARQ